MKSYCGKTNGDRTKILFAYKQTYLLYLSSKCCSAHKAPTNDLHCSLSLAEFSRVFHVQPLTFISVSTVLLHVSLGLPLFLLPAGVQRIATLEMAYVTEEAVRTGRVAKMSAHSIQRCDWPTWRGSAVSLEHNDSEHRFVFHL